MQVCGSGRHGMSQGKPVGHFLLDGGGEAHAFRIGGSQGELELREQAAAARECKAHAAEFPKETVPPASGDTTPTVDLGEYREESLGPVCGQGDGFGEGVNNPPQNRFLRAPIAVTIQQFFGGNGLSAVVEAVGGVVGAEDGVIDVEENIAQAMEASGGPLPEEDFIIYINVSVGQRMSGGGGMAMGRQGGDARGRR